MDIRPKGFIKRVFDFAVAELERRSRPAPAYEPGADEMEGEPGLPPELGSRPEALASISSTARLAPVPDEAEGRHGRPPLGGLQVARSERGGVRVRWSLAHDELDRSATLIDDGAVLCLRLVSFSAGRDHVMREVQDRPSIGSQGECEIARPEGRAVVALGLRSGGRFVSIAHHVV